VEIRVPGDKSISHRALLLAALARGGSRLRGVLPGADPSATAAILRALGVPVPVLPPDGGEIRVPGVGLRGLRSPSGVLDCENSGTTARLLLGVLAGQPLEAVLTGDQSLRRRPMERVTRPLSAMGARFHFRGEPGFLPLEVVGGPLQGLEHTSPVSSAQVKSAILLAGLVGGVPVSVTEPVRSRDHTERMLAAAGVRLEEEVSDGGWRVAMPEPPGALAPLELEVPGDISSAAFLLALGLILDLPLVLPRVGVNPTRTGILPVLERMGARIRMEDSTPGGDGEAVATLVVEGGELRGTEIGGEEIPSLIDEIPVLAILAARARGTTRITGAAELRVKESDRIRALVDNLRAVGVQAEELEDGLEVQGSEAPPRGGVRSHHDHRIAMAFGVLGAIPGSGISVEGREVVDVSFPGFWEILGQVRERAASRRTAPGGSVAGTGDLPPRTRVVTVDGPAGSGKSSTAREVARRLGFRHLDSGSLYRALTFALQEEGMPEERWATLTSEELATIPLHLEPVDGGFRPRLGDRPLDEELRTPRVNAGVARLAELPAVRERLLTIQRAAAAEGGLVADGRDMGTAVFPDAEFKVFLTADLRERARRRLAQEGKEEAKADEVEAEAHRLEARDRTDSGRSASPLRRPPGALEVDTTHLTFEGQVEEILKAVRGLTPP